MIVTRLIVETTLIPKLIVKQEKTELGYHHKMARRVSINLYSKSSQDKSSVKVFFRENEKFFAEVMDEFWMGAGNDWA
jgi:hypothetical protein